MVAQGQPVDNHVRLHIGKILPRRFDMDDDVRFRQFMLYNAFNGFRHIMGVIHVQFRRRFHIQLYKDARASVTQADAFDRIIRGILFMASSTCRVREEEPPSIRAWMERLARPKATEQTRAATNRAAMASALSRRPCQADSAGTRWASQMQKRPRSTTAEDQISVVK